MSNQINTTITRVTTGTLFSCINNFQLISALTTTVNYEARIIDLILPDDQSNIQTLLVSIQSILNNNVARGLASFILQPIGNYDNNGNSVIGGGYNSAGVLQPNKVIYNYQLQYSSNPNVSSTLILYSIDLSYFYTAKTSSTYGTTANSISYSNSVTNFTYISEVSNVIMSIQQCKSLNDDYTSSFN